MDHYVTEVQGVHVHVCNMYMYVHVSLLCMFVHVHVHVLGVKGRLNLSLNTRHD